MNKKLLRKLTLSAVTLGVAAVSATTSTFAWFTTNGTVTASNVTGTVKASDALVLIKSPTAWVTTTTTKDQTTTTTIDPKYTTTVNQTDASGSVMTTTDESNNVSTLTTESTHNFATSTTLVNEGGDGNVGKLAPVAIGSTSVDGTLLEKDDSATNTTNSFTKKADNTHYLHYQVVLAISSLDSSKTYEVKMSLPSLNTSVNSQYLLADSVASSDTNYSSYKAGQTVSVGVKDVLSVGIKNTIVSGTSTAQTYGLSSGVNLTTTSGTDQQYKDDASGWYHAIAEVSDKADAVTYYNNVYGLTGTSAIARPKHKNDNPGESDKDANGNVLANQDYSTYYKNDALYTTNYQKGTDGNNTSTIESITCTDKVIYKLAKTTSAVVVTDLYFFIDGWDYQCFNAVSGMDLFATGSNQISFTVAEYVAPTKTEDTE